MKLLALIPARGGSKGIPRKNIRDLLGKPLVAWTIDCAKQSPYIDSVVVSTDDQAIAEVARHWGADVPFLRPTELATDTSSGMDPVLHAMEQLPEYDWVLILQPTSPLRTVEDINAIVQLCLERDAPAAVSVSEACAHPDWVYRCNSKMQLVPFTDTSLPTRRQDLSAAYALNGSLYLARCDWLLEQQSFLSKDTLGYKMPVERSADIDTELDWQWVEFLMRGCNP